MTEKSLRIDDLIDLAFVKSGIPYPGDKFRKILTLLLDTCMRIGYNQAVKDCKKGEIKEKSLTHLKEVEQ